MQASTLSHILVHRRVILEDDGLVYAIEAASPPDRDNFLADWDHQGAAASAAVPPVWPGRGRRPA